MVRRRTTGQNSVTDADSVSSKEGNKKKGNAGQICVHKKCIRVCIFNSRRTLCTWNLGIFLQRAHAKQTEQKAHARAQKGGEAARARKGKCTHVWKFNILVLLNQKAPAVVIIGSV